MLVLLAGGLAGCDSGSTSSEVPPLAPLAYTGVPTAANIASLSVDQQKILANSATRGVAVAIQYQQEDRSVVLDQLARVVSKTGVDTLTSPSSKTTLPAWQQCTNKSPGTISYYARDTAGRYLVVNFDHACVPYFAIPDANTQRPLLLNGGLVVDSQHHTFTADNLSILNMSNAKSAVVPVGSYKLNGGSLTKLYFCKAGVCQIDVGTWGAVINNSYSTGCSAPGCTVTASTVYDPMLGKVSAVADHLLPCSSNLGAGLDSPFAGGTLTLTGTSGSLIIAYSGCGSPIHGGNW